ncbi:glycerophosphodiester phosphodiesterase family protein [Inquilinus sp.]|uniref:glycerophosphodiester phosphodiesterase family protein n=1 Tax=Inquilinus sp. TaxID=1932117 RepID=UPI0031E3C290
MTRRTRKRLVFVLVVLGVFAAFVFINNSSWLYGAPGGPPVLLAHRGLAQGYSREGLTGDTCTAARMLPPEHPYLENTIASMRAAFGFGADAVELDIHPTTDGRFAVFHDWTVDCRTQGHGVTREHSLGELQALDIGYGYTADGGRTYPFRGTGVGLMPSLDQVLDSFPGRRFLLNVKSNDPAEGALLADTLAALPPDRLELLAAYGGDRPIAVLRERLPAVRSMSRASIKECFIRYAALGWTGHVPESCRRSVLLVPSNVAPWLWGWPHLFVARMQAAGSPVFLIGPWGGGFSEGIDDPALIADLVADGYAGGIETDRIDRLGPGLRQLGGPG